MKILTAYFSAEGTTARLAKAAAEKIGSEVFEIVPEQPYTKADIRYTNPLSRCNREMIGKKDVPVAGRIEDFDSYDLILLGFPIWYYGAPNVIKTFCRDYDWSGRKLVLFATSGGSDIGRTVAKLGDCIKGADVVNAKVVRTPEELEELVRPLI